MSSYKWIWRKGGIGFSSSTERDILSSADLIKKILYDARALRDGRMPTFNISDAEADDIISYLKTQTPLVESATANTSE
jgi:mono/diheme cytochrome c family protein